MGGTDSRVRRIALTGGIATGKTWVRSRFEDLGVPTIDSDVLAREAVAVGTPGLGEIVTHFGLDILLPSGALDRQKLAGIVFADPDARRVLETIVHPQVKRATEEWFAMLDSQSHPWAVADIPLLYETGRDRDFDGVVVVACEPETQVRRVIQRDGLSEQEARKRLAAQWPIAEKAAKADYVIRTDGTLAETDEQVTRLWNELSRAAF